MNSFIKKKPITQTDIQRRVGLVSYYKMKDDMNIIARILEQSSHVHKIQCNSQILIPI